VPSGGALGQFAWCGHGGLIGARPPYPFESPSKTLALLAEDPREAIHQLRCRMAGAPSGPPVALPTGSSARPATVQRRRRGRPPIDHLIAETCARHEIDPTELLGGRRRRKVIAARREIVLRAVLEAGLSGCEVARTLGVSEATVSRALDQTPVSGNVGVGCRGEPTGSG
jgi:hypothetical protein